MIIDERSYPNLEDAKRRPTWSFLKAATVEATAIWPAFWVRSHADYGMALDRLSDAIEKAGEKLVRPSRRCQSTPRYMPPAIAG